MQILGPHPGQTELETLGMGPSNPLPPALQGILIHSFKNQRLKERCDAALSSCVQLCAVGRKWDGKSTPMTCLPSALETVPLMGNQSECILPRVFMGGR